METSIFLPALPEASDALPFPSITDRTELRQESERPGKRDPAVRAEGCWFRGSGSLLEGFMLGGRVGRLLMQPPVHNGATPTTINKSRPPAIKEPPSGRYCGSTNMTSMCFTSLLAHNWCPVPFCDHCRMVPPPRPTLAIHITLYRLPFLCCSTCKHGGPRCGAC